MFEEMCELEGISQSEMLTRWIDARSEQKRPRFSGGLPKYRGF